MPQLSIQRSTSPPETVRPALMSDSASSRSAWTAALCTRSRQLARRVRALFDQAEDRVDYARAVLTINQMVDPSIDVKANLAKIDAIVKQIKATVSPGAKSWDKMLALRKYLYEKGGWNDFAPFAYDFDDPLGTKIANKLIPNYLASKKGNCISMPVLFIVLGQRLGLDVTASTAPLHIFVKYTDSDTGKVYNIETTSGGNPARDDWYREHMPMTDQAIANGLYLQRLTKRETLVVMATVLTEHRAQREEYEAAIALSDLALEYYPKDVNAMLRKGSANYRLLKKDFLSKYRSIDEIPADRREYFQRLSEGNRYWFAKAESLGWREPDRESEDKYKQAVQKDGAVQK